MGGVENPDTSLARRLKHSSQYRRSKTTKEGRTRARPTRKTTARKEQKQHKTKEKGGEGASVEKPDTSLARQFKHLNRKHRDQKHPTHKKQETTAQPRRRTRQ